MQQPDVDPSTQPQGGDYLPENPPLAGFPSRSPKRGLTGVIATGEFLAGFFGFFLLNALAAGVSVGVSYLVVQQLFDSNTSLGTILALVIQIWSIVVLFANIIALPILAFYRRRVFWGVLAAWGVSFVLVICAGVIITVVCFTALSTN